MDGPTPLERFEAMLRLEQKSDATINSYLKGIKKFERYLAAASLPFDGTSVLPFITNMNDVEKAKPATMRLYIISLKRYFEFLKDQGIKDVALPKMKYPTVYRSRPKFLDKEEFQRLYNGTFDDPLLRAMVSTTYATAMRVSEICESRVREYNLGDKPSKLVSGKTPEMTDATLPLTTTAVADIRAYLKDVKSRTGYVPGPDDYMFFNPKDVKRCIVPREANERLYQTCRKLDMKKIISWHWIRHTRATHLREDGVELLDIGDLMRHTSLNTTKIYAWTDTEKLRKKVNRDDILGAKKKEGEEEGEG